MDKIVLNLLILAPLAGCLALFILVPKGVAPRLCKMAAQLVSLVPLVASLFLLRPLLDARWMTGGGDPFSVVLPWFTVGDLTVRYALFVDGLSLPLIALTALLTTLVIGYSIIE